MLKGLVDAPPYGLRDFIVTLAVTALLMAVAEGVRVSVAGSLAWLSAFFVLMVVGVLVQWDEERSGRAAAEREREAAAEARMRSWPPWKRRLFVSFGVAVAA